MLKVDICNQALSLIGESPIRSLEENSVNAIRCHTLYDSTRKALLRMHPFNSCTRRIQIQPMTTSPDFGYTHQFQLPDDLVRVIDTNTTDYTLETDKLLSNSNVLNMVYVFDNKNETTFDSLLVECLVLLLGSKLSKAVTGSQATADTLYQQCQQVMAQAKAVQAQEKPSPTFGDYDVISLLER